jgi:ankyrin repeat protein
MKQILIKIIAFTLLVNSSSYADPIHIAAETGDLAGVQVVLDKGVDVNAKDEFGRTPLHLPSQNGHIEVVELLIAKGADVNAKTKNGDTALHYAVSNDRNEIVELLIAEGADVNAKTNIGTTPLHGAHNIKTIELLISKGADINVKANSGLTLLHRARTKEIAELLISKGADVNAKDSNGFNAFWFAVKRNIEVVEVLIENGADLNIQDRISGLTPLHHAAGNGDNDMVELLITSGADLNAKGVIKVNKVNRFGATPLDYALTKNNRRPQYDTADLLRKYGGRSGPEDIDYRFESINNTITQLQHLIIGDVGGDAPEKPSIEKLQGVFVVRGKVGGKYEVQYHTGDNNWQVREVVTLQSNRQLYIDSSSYDEKRFYRVKTVD